MKRRTIVFRVAVLVLVLILSVSALTSCGGGVTQAKDIITEFLTALESGDASTATSLFHPSTEFTEDELIASVANIQKNLGVNFADGYTVVLFKEPSINYTLNFPKGLIGEISIKLDVIVSGKLLNASVVVLEYGGQVGIASFLVNVASQEDGGDSENNESSDTTNTI